MKTILVATNYSREANNALKYAAALAKCTNAKILLFNSFEFSVHAANSLFPASSIDKMVARNKRHLKRLAAKTSKAYGICVEHITRVSDFKEELDFLVKRLNAELVVMGMNDVYYNDSFGNTTTSVIHHATYPVLVVPKKISFKEISKILFAFDADSMNAVNNLSLLKEVATFFNAEIQVYHVEKNKQVAATVENKAYTATIGVDDFFNGINHSYSNKAGNNVIKEIENGVKNFKADLLVMLPHKYGFFKGMLHKSKTSIMARKIHVPLLALPDSQMA